MATNPTSVMHRQFLPRSSSLHAKSANIHNEMVDSGWEASAAGSCAEIEDSLQDQKDWEQLHADDIVNQRATATAYQIQRQ